MEPIDQAIGKDNPRPLFLYPGFTKILKNDLENLLNNSLDPLTASGCTAAAEICEGVAADNKGGQGRDQVILGDGKGGAPERPPSKPPIKEEGRGGIFGGENEPSISVMAQISTTAAMTGNNVAVSTEKVQKGQSAIDLDGKEEILRDSTGGKCAQGSTGINMTGEGEGGPQDSMPANSGAVTETLDSVAPQNKTGQGREHKIEVDGKDETPGETIGQMSDDNMNRGSPGCGQTCCEDSVTAKSRSVTECLVTLTNDQMKRQEREHIVGFEIDEETPDDVPDQSPVKGLRIGNKGNNIYSLHDLAGAQNLGAVRNFFEEMCDRKHAIGHEDKEKTSAKIRGNQSIGIKNGQDFRRTGNIPQGSGTPQCEDVAVNIEVMANDEEGSKPEQGIVLQEKERYPDIIPDVPSIKIPSEVRKRDRKINPQDLLTTQSGAVADTVESTFIAVEIESRKRQSPKQAVTQNKNDNTPKQNDSETSFAEECEGKNQEPQAEPRHSVAIQGEAAAETIVAVGNTMERGGCRQAVDVSGGKEALNKYPDTSPFINLGEEHIAGTESEIQKSAIAHDETGPLVFEAVAMKDVYWRRWNRVLSRNEKDHIPHEVLKYFEGPNDQAAIRESYSRELAKAQGKAAKNISKASTADFEGNPGGNQVNGVRGNKEVLISNPDTNFSESLCGEDDGGRKGLPQVLSIKQSETVRETLETMTMKIEGRCKWERAIGPEKKNDPRENLPKLDLESRSVESIRGGEKDPRSSKKGQGGTATGTFEAMAVNTEDRRWWDGIFGVEGEKGAPVKPSNKSSVKVWDKEVTDGKKIIPRSSVTPFVETLTEPLVCVTLYAKPGQGQGQSQGVGCKERENTQTNPLYKLSTDGPGEEYTGESKIKTHGSAEEKDTTEKPMSMVLSIDSEEEEGVEGDIMHEDMKEVLGKHANEAPMENLGEKQTGRKHNGHDNTKTAKSKPRAMAAEILGAWAVPDKEGLGRKLSVGSEPNADARDAHLSVVLNRNPDELFFGSQRKVRAPGKETVDKNEFSFSKINLAFVRGDDSPTEHEAEGVKAPAADDRMGSLGIKLLNRKEDQACQSTVVCSVNGSSVVEASAGARARTVELGKVVEVPEFMETSCESFDQESARLRSLEVGLSSKKWKLRETLTGIHSIETESEREKDLLAWSTTSGCASNWVSNKSSALNVARPIDVGFSRGRGEQDSESVLPTSVDTGASDYLCDKDSAELGLARCSTSAKNNWIGPAAAHSEQTELRGRSISVDTPIAGNGDSDEKCNEEKARSKLLVAGPFNTKRAQSEKSSMAREVGLQFGVEGGWEVAGLTSGAAPERIDRESYRVRPLETDLQSRKEEETEDSGVSFAVKTQFGGERNLGESCASDGDHRGSSDGKGFEIGPSKDSLAELEYNGSDGQAVVRPPFETDVSRRKRNAIGYFVIQKTELRGEPGSVAVSSAETKSGGGSDSSEIDVGGEVCSPPLSPGSRSGDIFEGSVDEKWPWLSQFQKPPHEDGTVPRSLDGSTLVDYPGKGYLLFSDGDGAPSRASDDAHEDAVEARMEEETSLYVFVLAGACLSFFALFCMFHASQETWRQPSLVIDTRLKHPSLIPDQTSSVEEDSVRVRKHVPTCSLEEGSPSEPSTQTSKAILQGGATAHYMNSVGCADLQSTADITVDLWFLGGPRHAMCSLCYDGTGDGLLSTATSPKEETGVKRGIVATETKIVESVHSTKNNGDSGTEPIDSSAISNEATSGPDPPIDAKESTSVGDATDLYQRLTGCDNFQVKSPKKTAIGLPLPREKYGPFWDACGNKMRDKSRHPEKPLELSPEGGNLPEIAPAVDGRFEKEPRQGNSGDTHMLEEEIKTLGLLLGKSEALNDQEKKDGSDSIDAYRAIENFWVSIKGIFKKVVDLTRQDRLVYVDDEPSSMPSFNTNLEIMVLLGAEIPQLCDDQKEDGLGRDEALECEAGVRDERGEANNEDWSVDTGCGLKEGDDKDNAAEESSLKAVERVTAWLTKHKGHKDGKIGAVAEIVEDGRTDAAGGHGEEANNEIDGMRQTVERGLTNRDQDVEEGDRNSEEGPGTRPTSKEAKLLWGIFEHEHEEVEEKIQDKKTTTGRARSELGASSGKTGDKKTAKGQEKEPKRRGFGLETKLGWGQEMMYGPWY